VIYAKIYVDGKYVGDAGVTATTEIGESHARELGVMVQKVLNNWLREQEAK
jgi:hypothetical protein